jgi:deoxyribodipyrimidine photo-lyase
MTGLKFIGSLRPDSVHSRSQSEYEAGDRVTKVLYWFRNDLRIFDNPALSAAVEAASSISFIYVHDPRLLKQTCAGIPRLGWHRRRFLAQTLADLRHSLKKNGYDLLEVYGQPEKILPAIAEKSSVGLLSFSRETAPEECSVENELILECQKIGVRVGSDWTQFLVSPADLPFPAGSLPQTFTDFRNTLEKIEFEKFIPSEPCRFIAANPPLHFKLNGISGLKLDDLGLIFRNSGFEADTRFSNPTEAESRLLSAVYKAAAPVDKARILTGGESQAAARRDDYIFGQKNIRSYFETRNGLLNSSDSTLFSAWLANGSLSVRDVFRNVKKYEAVHGAGKNSYWVIFELLWREFFKHHLVRSGVRFFAPEGLYRRSSGADNQLPASALMMRIDDVLACRTEDSFVNANMRELLQTGFMSNRGRQNVASFLIYDLQIPWISGAQVFESLLIDYDAASNWGNWAYIAGVSFDPRGGRKFNTVKQRQDYDPSGSYVAAWSV